MPDVAPTPCPPPRVQGGGIQPELSAEVVLFMEGLALRRLSRHTARAYRQDFALIERHLGAPLVRASVQDIERYWHAIREARPATIRRKQAAVRQFFRWCAARRLATDDPTVHTTPPRLARRLPVFLSMDHVQRLWRCLRHPKTLADWRDAALLKTFYYTGMRASELESLDLDDVWWREGCIRVVGKGDKERQLPLHPSLAKALRAWVDHRPPTASRALFLTLRHGHGRLTYHGIYLIVKTRFQQADIDPKRFSPHKLRHTFATHLLARQVPINEISKLLGHARLDTTQIYAHTDEGRLRLAVEKL